MSHPYDLEDANEPYVKYEMLNGVMYGEPPYEISGGKKIIMSPAPNYHHGSIVMLLGKIFLDYIIENNINATVLGDNFDVYLSKEFHYRPDISVICDLERVRNGKRLYDAPDLVVEVLSKATMKRDTGEKKDRYEESGVREYWIVDPNNKSVKVYHLVEGKFEDNGDYYLDGSGSGDKIKVSIFEDLTVELKMIFRFQILLGE